MPKPITNFRSILLYSSCALVFTTATIAPFYFFPDRRIEWFISFLSSFLGGLLGIIGALAIYFFQIRTEQKSMGLELQNLLEAELSDINRALQFSEPMTIHIGPHQIRVKLMHLQTLTIDKAALSGHFDSITSENLLHLSRKIKMLNSTMNNMQLLIALNPANTNTMQFYAENINRNSEAIIRDIGAMEKKANFKIRTDHPEEIQRTHPDFQGTASIA